MVKMTILMVSLITGISFFAWNAKAQVQDKKDDSTNNWESCGWGGGGFFWATVFHPTKDGVIYLGLDVGGVCKTTDHGMNWKPINNGLKDYGVYSLAVDRSNPETVYAGTEGGLHKSIDGGNNWQLLPKTGPKELRLTAERGKSVRSIAVDPTNGSKLYAASPSGKVYRSIDGGQNWVVAYDKKSATNDQNILRVQFGKANNDFFGGIWLPLTFPKDAKTDDCIGIGFSFKGEKIQQKDCFVTIKTNTGASYRSKNVTDIFKNDQWKDIVLKADDFVIDPDYAKKNPEAAKKLSKIPEWATVNRLDLCCSGAMKDAAVGSFGKFFFAFNDKDKAKPVLKTVRDFNTDKSMQKYGNIRFGQPPSGAAFCVAVSAKNSSLVIAATDGSGLVMSEDYGKTWSELNTPKRASSAKFAETDPNIIFGSFFNDGIWKSIDKGKTWTKMSEGIVKPNVIEVAVSPTNPLDVYAIGDQAWQSNDGGATWKKCPPMKVDLEGNPTRHFGGENPTTPIIRVKNIAINPQNPKELYIACDWRATWSGDSGLSWYERVRGADISCITDIRFSKGRTYATAMDEGLLVTENNGKKWRQLWPLKYIQDMSGHCWRVAVDSVNGVDQIVSAFSPWNNSPKTNIVVVSHDGGKTQKLVKNGLPNYQIRPNTMWGEGYIRSLASDPSNPKVVYAGIDGDPDSGKSGGGIFKSVDGGNNWKQLPNQPGSRRMYYGLAVDPTDPKRIFWGSCGNNGGVWMTEDGGSSWKNVFTNETWIWNVLVTKEGVVYAGGANLWRSSDHGKTWTQLTKFTNGRAIVGMESDPRDPKTFWLSATTWNGSSDGGIFKTVDSGKSWKEITGNIPYRKPQVLRFNPETNELWAGWVGLYKIKQ